jgi:23S rRNA pseudouridine1911/1915/1917 synthase
MAAFASSSPSSVQPPSTPRPRVTHTCPACGQRCVRPGVFERHLGACCPDLIPRPAWRAAVAAGAEADLLATAAAAEADLRARAVALAFRTPGPDGGPPIRRSAADVAATLGLPVDRVAASLKAAMRAVPLAADHGSPLDIIFEDDWVLALAKPAGLITAPKHRYTGGSLVNRAIAYLGEGRAPFPVHRLDQFTSGVVVMGKHSAAAAGLHAQFRERTAVKRYLAVVVGRVDGGDEGFDCGGEEGVLAGRTPTDPPGGFAVAAPIGRHPGHEVARATLPPGDADGAASLTLFRPVSFAPARGDSSLDGVAPAPLARSGTLARLRSDGATLLCAAPRTGRTHQIRVHAAAVGHPLIGDDLYGALAPSWAPRQLLHAATLDLLHPGTGEPLRLAAPLPPDFAAALDVLGLECPADLAGGLPEMGGWGPPPPV